MDILLQADNLTKYYREGDSMLRALDSVTLTARRGDFLTFTRPKGPGAAALFRILAGLERPSSGKIRLCRTEITELSGEQLPAFRRRHMGLLFRECSLLPCLNLLENILLPLSLDNRQPDLPLLKQASRLLRLEDKLHLFPSQVSPVHCQRAALLRAIAAKPRIILAHQPESCLAPEERQSFLELLEIAGREFYQTILITREA